MPPFLPRKRLASTPPPDPQPAPAKKAKLGNVPDSKACSVPSLGNTKHFSIGESDSDSSLSEVDSDDFEDVPSAKGKDIDEAEHEDEEEGVEWEDAAREEPEQDSKPNPVIGDIQLTFRKDEGTVDYGTAAIAPTGKKGPTKREKEVRLRTHCMHVQFLLYHNAIRNRWICDAKVQKILVDQLPPQIRKEVDRWRTASGLDPKPVETEKKPATGKTKRKGKQKQKQNEERNGRDWGTPAERLEQGKPDLSHGDPLIHLMKVLSAYWKKRFAITAPGLRKRGYGTKIALKQEISSLRNDDHDHEKHGEKIENLKEFRKLAMKCEGSRDVGAQLFTALLRGLGIESRLVASLQPSGFGWTKAEQMLPWRSSRNANIDSSDSSDDDEPESSTSAKAKGKDRATPRSSARGKPTRRAPGNQAAPIDLDSDAGEALDPSDTESVVDVTPSMPKRRPAKYDRDLAFPIYWTEAVSPVTNTVLPVSPLVLPNAVAATPEILLTFEPRGAKAEKGKQVMAYVVAYSPDGSAKDVTVRYLRKRLWPGKTKGFRMPIEKVPVYNKRGKVKRYEEYDWFKHIMSGYVRTDDMRTAVDDVEESTDLVPAEPEKKNIEDEGDTLQSLKASADWVLERHLRREQALRPHAEPDRTFVTGKGDNIKEEPVYRRSDVERCLTAESWHKEGRRPKAGEIPMKLVPVRAVTLTRKREAEEHHRQTGEKQMQGLYTWDQTEYIIPPPIKDGIIPKNSYGNMDCFVPSMVPRGAVHVPLRGTVRICKKLQIDFAEAVTGFEFGNKRAVPVCTGVVVAAENEQKLREAWNVYNEEQRKKEEGKMEKISLDLWRKMIMGLRIRERIVGEYGDEPDGDGMGTVDQPIDINDDVGGGFVKDADEEMGGGFLLPHEEDEPDGGDLVVEHHEPEPLIRRRVKPAEQYPTPSSMPPPNSTPRRQRKNLLSGSTESSELSDLSSSVTSESEDLKDEVESAPQPSELNFHVEIPTQRRPRGQPLHLDGTASPSSDDNHMDGEESPADDTEDEEEYTPEPKTKSKPTASTRKPPARASKQTASTSKTTTPTPNRSRRLLRRDSTIVRSPYFDADGDDEQAQGGA